jgi:hypothetical protein
MRESAPRAAAAWPKNDWPCPDGGFQRDYATDEAQEPFGRARAQDFTAFASLSLSDTSAYRKHWTQSEQPIAVGTA